MPGVQTRESGSPIGIDDVNAQPKKRSSRGCPKTCSLALHDVSAARSRTLVYQRLMDYWDEAMQDDVYLIVADGWVDAATPCLGIPLRQRNARSWKRSRRDSQSTFKYKLAS